MSHRTHRFAALVAVAALALAGCSGAHGQTIVVGSQDYYSNEIVAEIYAQALEKGGYAVDRQFRIGQREVYLPEIEAGNIDLFPEYTGPLLQFWKSSTTARLADAVYSELVQAAPAGLRVLDQSPATDQDSYVVTSAFASQWHLTTISDLKGVTVPLVMGANSEAQSRPNGPQGLLDTYGVTCGFTPIEDGGGPLTVKALKDGTIQLAIIYTADPSIMANDLVSLEDDKGLFLASHLVPLASDKVDDKAAALINKISAAMSPSDLVALDARSVTDQLPAATIATDWLKDKGLV
ncbi:MAG: ABC transporter substrate-binding protein [Propionibacteriaceae bacterium]|jgi:osmoprotectant transport system substrate-binding protein|nr:ABC transporter substrate-binding protein [Propionibacteriaceae bacterium]